MSVLLLLAGMGLQAWVWSAALGFWSAIPWIGLVLMHVVSAVLLTVGAPILLPPRFRPSATGAMAVVASVCLALPVLGPLVLLLAAWHLWRRDEGKAESMRILELPMPAFDGNLSHAKHMRVMGMARRAVRSAMPAEKKLYALMSLGTLPSAQSTRLLREALRDPEDEIRLVAYTLMERQEQLLTSRLVALQDRLEKAAPGEDQHLLRQRVVELQLELLHRQLAQGEWAQTLQAQAQQLALQAVQAHPDDAVPHLQLGRLAWLRADDGAAREHLERAAALGATPSRTVPYLAELALRDKDIPRLRRSLAALDPAALSPSLQRLRHFWTDRHA
jgi:hypothetical protein